MLKSLHARDLSDWEPTAFMRLRETVSETGDGTKKLDSPLTRVKPPGFCDTGGWRDTP